MPASKKDLKKNQQKKNVAAGIGDEKGRLPSQNKVRGQRVHSVHIVHNVYKFPLNNKLLFFQPENVMVACTICKQVLRMIKKNEQVGRATKYRQIILSRDVDQDSHPVVKKHRKLFKFKILVESITGKLQNKFYISNLFF